MYTVDKVVLVQHSRNHIPYFGYAVIVGPKGGKYVADEFCTEIMAKVHFDDRDLCELKKLIRQCREKNKVSIQDEDIRNDGKDIIRISKPFEAKPLIRKNGLEIAKKIGRNLII